MQNDTLDNGTMADMLLKKSERKGAYGPKPKGYKAILLTSLTKVVTTVDDVATTDDPNPTRVATTDEVKDAAAHDLAEKKQGREAVACGEPNGVHRAVTDKIKSGLPERVWSSHLIATGTKNIQLD